MSLTGSALRNELVSNVLREGLEFFTQKLAQCNEAMQKDFLERGLTPSEAQKEVNTELEELFLSHGVEIRKLRQIDSQEIPRVPENPENRCLWKEQEKIHDEIINNPRVNFLVTGPAGSGKTRLMTVLAENFLAKKVKVLCTALTSQLAFQFHEGHNFSRLLSTSPSEFDVILIDHGNLLPEGHLLKLDEILKTSTGRRQEMFGGKQICIFADFGQILPYTEEFKNQTEQSLNGKMVISRFKNLSLPWKISENELRNFTGQNFVSTMDALLQETFGSALVSSTMVNTQKFESRIILAPSNQTVEFLNREILKKIPGDVIELKGWSMAFSKKGEQLKTKECYAVDVQKVPNHSISLKPNCIIALLHTQDGLPKGTRLIFLEKKENFLRCQTLSGLRKGQEVHVHMWQYRDEPAIRKYPSGKTFEFFLNRKQFPISLAFATTIHQSQGQFFDRLGLYNMDKAFEKELQYTAITRCRNTNGIRVFVENSKNFI